MIPSTNSKLLVAEDWKKIYQGFRNADFKSYDFETIRRTMITYLRENYPEDFNDFIDSSEYIALIDLIAYLGQNLSFRIDLNARENFLETAQRRDSILRLAQLVSYVPKRNVPATGFLKITAVSTTDNVYDSNGTNLSNTVIGWNDPTNSNWFQQFVTIINSAMNQTIMFGKPYARAVVDGIQTEQYRLNSANTDVPVYSFLKSINGTAMNFEITSCGFDGGKSIYEEAPRPANSFSLIYKNDNQGSGSANTGFFCHFRQGTLGVASFSIDNPVPNEIVGVNTAGINDSDVWLWQLDSNGEYDILWKKVPSVTGNNIIYNSLDKNERNFYSVTSRDRDQIDLNFADGSFGNLPKGQFKLLYRQSNGLSYSIKPDQLSGVVVEIPYTNRTGQTNTLSITLSLQYTVNNSAGPESNASIQSKAPQAYYLQNRMVTAEDYNIAPLTLGSDILKVKSVNRSTSGISKYFELSDATGKYSRTDIFASDGIVYKNTNEQNFTFDFVNRNEVYAVIKQQLAPIISSESLRSFYFDKFSRITVSDFVAKWKLVNKVSGQSRGYFYDPSTDQPLSLGIFTTDNLKYLAPGSLVKFNNSFGNTNTVMWTTVVAVFGDGTNSGQGTLDDGTGPVIFSDIVPEGSTLVEIIPKYVSNLTNAFESELVNLCLNQRNFGLTINDSTRSWAIVLDTNLNLTSPFSLDFQGDKTNSSKDSSWLVAFTWTGKNYKVRYRLTNYVFESQNQTGFFVDTNNINYDFTNDTVIKDKITVLSINKSSTSTAVSLEKDYVWQIDGPITESDGYIEPKKVLVSFYDFNSSGQVTDPDTFGNIVQPLSTATAGIDVKNAGYLDKFVYFETLDDGLRYQITTSTIISFPTESVAQQLVDNDMAYFEEGQLVYFYDETENVVKRYSTTAGSPVFTYESKYYAYPGRTDLKFQYQHNSGEDRRIDPSKSNLVDVYLLTLAYDAEYRAWLTSGTGSEPLAPTSQSLEQNYSAQLEPIKTISDEIVFQPVRYKVLFGSKATPSLQATFKAVRNPNIPISDNELKSNILTAINEFFSLENWDFGQSFRFSELSAYVMNALTPNIINFVIVPKVSSFGNLYEISCLSNEIFISGATVNDISIIDAITATQLNLTNSAFNSGN
jgi:hypothetical protein